MARRVDPSTSQGAGVTTTPLGTGFGSLRRVAAGLFRPAQVVLHFESEEGDAACDRTRLLQLARRTSQAGGAPDVLFRCRGLQRDGKRGAPQWVVPDDHVPLLPQPESQPVTPVAALTRCR